MLTTKSVSTLIAMVLALAACGHAQMQDATAKSSSSSRFDLAGAYSWWSPHGSVQGFSYNNDALGMLFSGAYFFNSSVGVQVEVERHQQTATEGMRSFSAGVAIRRSASRTVTPFGHVLLGACGVTGPNVSNGGSSGYYENPQHWGVALTAGGGLDVATALFHHRLALRLIQADYQFSQVDFGSAQPTTGGRANINAARLSTGIVFRIGK
jgi:hypothetical protein